MIITGAQRKLLVMMDDGTSHPLMTEAANSTPPDAISLTLGGEDWDAGTSK